MRTKTFESPHHADTVMMKLNQDRKTDAKYSDFRISADGSTFPIHKSIVGPQSEYFDAMFFSAMKEQYLHEATVEGIAKDIIAHILDFFYSGTIEITSSNVYEMMKAANYLNISAIKTFCTEFLLEEVALENCLALKRFSKSYDLNDVSEKVDNFIEKHFGSVINSDEFKTLEFDEVKSVLLLKKTKLRTTEKNCSSTTREIEKLLPPLMPLLKCFGADKQVVLQLANKLAEFDCFSSSHITELNSALSNENMDEFFMLFITYFKESAQDNWKDRFLEALRESDLKLRLDFLELYLEGYGFFSWFVNNWEFLQNSKDDLLLVAKQFEIDIDLDGKGEFWLSYYVDKISLFEDDDLLQFIQALCLVSKNSELSSSVVSEDRVFDAVIGWVVHDISTRASRIPTLFSTLEVEAIPWDHIQQVVIKEPLIEGSVECMKLLVQAMAVHPRTRRQRAFNVTCAII